MANGNSIYNVGSILYIVLSFILIITSLILIKKYINSEKIKYYLVKAVGLILFILIIVNKAVSFHKLSRVIPESFCGLCSFFLGIVIVFFKKDSIALHGISYFGFLGGLFAGVYPNYLVDYPIWTARGLTGLLHHSLMVFAVLLMITTGYLKPTIKRWYVPPISYMLMVVFGLFLIQVLDFPNDTMLIFNPLLSSMPHLTSWYGIGIECCIASWLFLILYERFAYKKEFRQIFRELKYHK